MRFDGSTVLVAGGTGALGRSVVEAFLAEGATVIAAARRESEAASLADAVGAARARLRFVQADVGDAAGAERAVAAAQGRGPLSAVVNAVGGWTGGKSIQSEGPEVLSRMLALNLAPGYFLLRAVLPSFLSAGSGAFVEIVALAALGAQPRQAAYAASKAAALSLVLSAAEEARGSGVRVNALLPGTMDTEANRRAMPGSDRSGWVSTVEVARAVLFLCSDDARAVSGAAIPLRGS
jgi:NAD(P)-dependent dehydrogenase (short-subunit alcohol dehydrogenase family)